MKALKIISDLLPIPSYTVILICFFFPFITIKCGTTELASVTGFDYVIGTDMKEKMKDNEFSKKLEKQLGKDLFGAAGTNPDSLEVDEDGKPLKAEGLSLPEETQDEKSSRIVMMIMMGIPFFMAIAGLIISFVKVKRKGLLHILFSSIGFIVLLVFGIIIKNSDELNAITSMGDMGGGMISIGMGTAYYMATILFLLVIMFFGMQKYLKKLYKEEQAIQEEALDEFLTKE